MTIAQKPASDLPDRSRVALTEVSKRFSAIRALERIDLQLRGGEVHALCGENGAGKSTLIQILGGALRPDSGRIEVDGKAVKFRDPAAALAEGIAVIHQELNLVETFTVAENMALGYEPRVGSWIDRREIEKRARSLLAELRFDLDPGALVGRLTVGQRQQVEIAKAIGRQAHVLVLDEPTAALSRAETEQLFKILRSFRSRGLSILYVSHHLEEVFEIADQITVLRDGRKVGTWKTEAIKLAELVASMVGEAVDVRAHPARKVTAAPLLCVAALRAQVLRGVDIEVRPGEVVGLTGLAGAGHEELAALLFGAKPFTSGQIIWKDRPYHPRHPLDARRAGMAYLPPDRRGEGLIPTLGILENLTLASLSALATVGWIHQSERRALAHKWCALMDVSAARNTQRVTTLSGGNQQKVLLARWAALEPDLFILNEPTRGIDVKTREAVHRWIEELAGAGCGVLLVSSDTQEMIRLADRCYIFRGGSICCQIQPPELEEHSLVTAMMGG